MQVELCFNLPQSKEALISARDWRHKLSVTSTGILPNWFFWRDEEGKTIKDFPQIRFLGGRALRIVAFGKDSSERLTGLMPTLFKLVSRAAETSVPVRMNEYEVAAPWSYPQLYHVSVPMLTQRGSRRERYSNDADARARTAHVTKRVVHGLVRQAHFFGLDFPLDDDIDLLECGDYRAQRVHDGIRYGVQYAIISMPVNLKGIWQTGLLLSHGHGAVTPYRRRVEGRQAA